MPYLGKQPASVPVTADDIPDNSITAAKIVDGGITAADIGADAVGLSELSATGTASTSTFLRGDNAWVAVDTNLVSDNSPQLGGDLDLNSNNITGTGGIPAANLTGTIAAARLSTATTQSASDNSTKIATTAYTDAQVATVVDSAPGTLNTLNELAAALGDDANFSTTVTNSIAAKLPLAGGTMTGNLTVSRASGNAVTRLQGASNSQSSKLFISHTSSGSGGLFYSGNVFDIFSYGDIRINSGTGNVNDTIANERIVIKNTGLVGIGTSSPSKTLSVHSTSGSAGTPNGLYIYNEVHGSDSQIYMYAENDSGSNQGANIKLDPDAETFSFIGTGGQTAITIADSGNVGIGESSPDNLLHITSAGSDTTLIKLENTNADSYPARMTFVKTSASPATDDDIGKIDFYGQDSAGNSDRYALMRAKIKDKTSGSEDGALIFSTVVAGSNVDTMQVSGGRVGIGTTSPAGSLEIKGGNASEHLVLSHSSGSSYTSIGQDSSDNLRIYSGTNERMRIDSSGRVGIGNTVAGTLNGVNSSILTVGTGSGHSGMTVYTGSTNEGAINFADDTSGSGTYKGMVRYDHNTNALTLHSNATERMRFDSTGNVGIGRTPAALLHLQANVPEIRFTYTGNSGYSYIKGGANNDLVFSTGTTTGTERMELTGGGILNQFSGTAIQNGVSKYLHTGTINSSAVVVNVDHTIGNSSGNVALVEAVYSHHAMSSYGCAYMAYIACYNGSIVSETVILDLTTSNGGSWVCTTSTAGTLRVTKNAGSYAGGGEWFVKVTTQVR